jgi:amidophosphoribosyltransferase
MHRNLILAGNFNMTVKNFSEPCRIRSASKEMADTVTVMEKIGHF